MDTQTPTDFKIERLPKDLQDTFRSLYANGHTSADYLTTGEIHHGDALELLSKIAPNSVALSVWSPPYFVGKEYEADLTFDGWQHLLEIVIACHFPIIKPGGFLVINIADILVFRDEAMPRVQADVVQSKRSPVTREDVLRAMAEHPEYNRYQLARLLGCSEQTIDRRLHGNNIRGGKYEPQTRVKIVGGLIEEWALKAGFYPYDRRIWVKDAAWENSRWASLSYRSVDEFEYLYFFWKPGITKYDRARLTADEWRNWGSRGVWTFPFRARQRRPRSQVSRWSYRCASFASLTEPGEIVLDCFMGSGTTALAALQLNRQYIGIELQPEYVELARSAVHTGVQIKLLRRVTK
jgi:DNA modification methylase